VEQAPEVFAVLHVEGLVKTHHLAQGLYILFSGVQAGCCLGGIGWHQMADGEDKKGHPDDHKDQETQTAYQITEHYYPIP
jgi:hypothetical protein